MAGREFDAGMTSASSMRVQALLGACDFPGRHRRRRRRRHGTLLAGDPERQPDLRGVLFDRPRVIDGAAATLEREGVADRCRLVGGDFFEAVPGGGDLYVLAVVVHDWTDEPATAILRSCRRGCRRTRASCWSSR